MFTDTLELEDIKQGKADPEYLDLLRRVTAIQADCEIGGPHLYVDDMLPGAPARIDQLVVARTAAEEIDHFRKSTKGRKPRIAAMFDVTDWDPKWHPTDRPNWRHPGKKSVPLRANQS